MYESSVFFLLKLSLIFPEPTKFYPYKSENSKYQECRVIYTIFKHFFEKFVTTDYRYFYVTVYDESSVAFSEDIFF